MTSEGRDGRLVARIGPAVRFRLAKVPGVLRVGARPLASLRDIRNADLRRAFPGYRDLRARTLAAAVGLWVLAAVVASLTHWAVMVVVVAPFVVEALWLAWRRRAGWGTRHGWPPGGVGVGPEHVTQPDYLSARERRFGPVFKGNHTLAPMACIADLGLATNTYRARADDLGMMGMWFNRFIPTGGIRWGAGRHQAELRNLFARAVAPTLVRSWRPVMERRVRATLAEAARADGADTVGISLRDPLRGLVLGLWAEILLGVPEDDPAFPEVCERFTELDVYREPHPPDHQIEAWLDRLASIVQARAGIQGTDRVWSMADEMTRLEPGALGAADVMRGFLYNAITTRDDVGGLLLFVAHHVAEEPAWADALRADGEEGERVAERFVSEVLRLDQSEYLYRQTRREIEIGDYVVPEGWYVRVCTREIHRDPVAFPQPERFDPDRFLDGGCGRDVYAPFGIDHRACVAEVLTRTLAQVVALELARSFDLEVIDDGPQAWSTYRHIAPSSRFRVALRPRAGEGVAAG